MQGRRQRPRPPNVGASVGEAVLLPKAAAAPAFQRRGLFRARGEAGWTRMRTGSSRSRHPRRWGRDEFGLDKIIIVHEDALPLSASVCSSAVRLRALSGMLRTNCIETSRIRPAKT